jgi:AraC-like DNA-binding protein
MNQDINRTPLDKFQVVRESRLEDTLHLLSELYARPRMEVLGKQSDFRATLNNKSFENSSLSFSRFGAAVRTEFPESEMVAQVFPLQGNGENICGRTSAVMNSPNGIVVSANTGFKSKLDANYERIILRTSSKELTSVFSAMTGSGISGDLQFEHAVSYLTPSGRMLKGQVMFVADMLNSQQGIPDLVLRETEQLLMTSMLQANRHNHSRLFERAASETAANWQVRRAEEFIEANWQKPFNVQALATATGVSVRSLFRAFQLSGRPSPMVFLKQIRMQHARRFLLSGEGNSTITEIALSCGFGDVARFSKDYREFFHEAPSETLRRSRARS